NSTADWLDRDRDCPLVEDEPAAGRALCRAAPRRCCRGVPAVLAGATGVVRRELPGADVWHHGRLSPLLQPSVLQTWARAAIRPGVAGAKLWAEGRLVVGGASSRSPQSLGRSG